jgi:hypothetical protein
VISFACRSTASYRVDDRIHQIQILADNMDYALQVFAMPRETTATVDHSNYTYDMPYTPLLQR